MLTSIVTIAVEVKVTHPVQCRVGHRVAYLYALEVECWDVLIEPCCKACLAIPLTDILAAIGKVELCSPIGVLLKYGRVDVEVVSHIVQDDVHLAIVCRSKHSAKLLISTETLIYNGAVDRPVTVVTRELGVGVYVLTPCVVGVLCDGRNPDCGDAQICEETLLNLCSDTCDVTALVVNLVQYLGRVELPVI